MLLIVLLSLLPHKQSRLGDLFRLDTNAQSVEWRRTYLKIVLHDKVIQSDLFIPQLEVT